MRKKTKRAELLLSPLFLRKSAHPPGIEDNLLSTQGGFHPHCFVLPASA